MMSEGSLAIPTKLATVAHDPDAIMVTIQGTGHEGKQTEAVYRVDPSGRSGGQVKLTGIEFIHLDNDGNPVERKLEELDGLKKDRWENLETTEFQMSTIPWVKILKLSADIGAIVLKDIPVVGTTMKVASAIASQGPDIVEDLQS
jgi:hypothetical protein